MMSIFRERPDDVTFVLTYLFFYEQRLKCKAKSWCLDVEILEFPRLQVAQSHA